MIRTCLKHINWGDKKAIVKDLREIYNKDTAEEAELELEKFASKWPKYPEIPKKWTDNWLQVSPFFDYPEPIRRTIYTTNSVEALHRSMRQVTKTKGAWISDHALEKQLYLGLMKNQKSWKRKIRQRTDFCRIIKQEFSDRIPEDFEKY